MSRDFLHWKSQEKRTLFWYLINLIQSSLPVCCDAPDHHLTGLLLSKHIDLKSTQVGIGWKLRQIRNIQFELSTFQWFISVKQHWHPPWEVTGSHGAEKHSRRGTRPRGNLQCATICLYDPFQSSQEAQQTVERRRDSALTFARQKAKERFMERNGKWNAKCNEDQKQNRMLSKVSKFAWL